jgi:hypothetical protein
MNAKRSAAVLLSSPAAAQRCAEGAGLDGGAVAASTIRHASIAAAAAMIADMISTRAAVFDGPSATARIYTRLTDVTPVISLPWYIDRLPLVPPNIKGHVCDDFICYLIDAA